MPRSRSNPGRVHGDVQGSATPAFESVYRLARRIPKGRVMTYGQIATCIENRLSPRAVGWALHGCPEDVPWQRIVNAQGACSTDRIPDVPTGLQRSLLEREGVVFRENGTLDLARYRWIPQTRPAGKSAAAPRKAKRKRGVKKS